LDQRGELDGRRLTRSNFIFIRRYQILYEEERKESTIAGGQVLLYIYFLLPTKIPNIKP
jgi:hypothetical protein